MIPKLEAYHHYSDVVRALGVLSQFNSQITEREHIPKAKIPYSSSNHKDPEEQMCRHLDRDDKVFSTTDYLAWRDVDSMPDSAADESTFQLGVHQNGGLPQHGNEARHSGVGPCRSMPPSFTQFKVTEQPHIPGGDLTELSARYQLPDFHATWQTYARNRPGLQTSGCLDAWIRFRLQVLSVVDEVTQLPWHMLRAYHHPQNGRTAFAIQFSS